MDEEKLGDRLVKKYNKTTPFMGRCKTCAFYNPMSRGGMVSYDGKVGYCDQTYITDEFWTDNPDEPRLMGDVHIEDCGCEDSSANVRYIATHTFGCVLWKNRATHREWRTT